MNHELQGLSGKMGIYWDKGRIQQVLIKNPEESPDTFFFLLEPVDDLFASENDDDLWEYQQGSHLRSAFRFGGEKAGISFNRGIIAVPFCGSLNVNEFAVERFNKREPEFNHLWYDHPKEED
jgi:hypothetical protein